MFKTAEEAENIGSASKKLKPKKGELGVDTNGSNAKVQTPDG